jgi:hypothetical protein
MRYWRNWLYRMRHNQTEIEPHKMVVNALGIINTHLYNQRRGRKALWWAIQGAAVSEPVGDSGLLKEAGQLIQAGARAHLTKPLEDAAAEGLAEA